MLILSEVLGLSLSLQTEFENCAVFKPSGYSTAALDRMLDQVVAWSIALAPLRAAAQPVAA